MIGDPAYAQRRWKIFFTVAAIHFGIIGGPLIFFAVYDRIVPRKVIAFRVKVGGREPSHAPEVGPPSRRRPAPDGGTPAAKPEPPKPAPPKPEPPKPAAKPKPVVKPKPVAKPKPVVKPKTAKTVKPAAKPTKPTKSTKPAKPTKQVKKTTKQTKPVKKPEDEVFHDSRWDNKPIGGGSNFNKNVPIGDRDRGQALGKTDNRTPAGGATLNEEKYWGGVGQYLLKRWTPPAGVFINQETAVTISLRVDARGKVLDKKIVRRSPNEAVNQSIERLLKELDMVAAPGEESECSFTLIPDEM